MPLLSEKTPFEFVPRITVAVSPLYTYAFIIPPANCDTFNAEQPLCTTRYPPDDIITLSATPLCVSNKLQPLNMVKLLTRPSETLNAPDSLVPLKTQFALPLTSRLSRPPLSTDILLPLTPLRKVNLPPDASVRFATLPPDVTVYP